MSIIQPYTTAHDTVLTDFRRGESEFLSSAADQYNIQSLVRNLQHHHHHSLTCSLYTPHTSVAYALPMPSVAPVTTAHGPYARRLVLLRKNA